MSAPSALRSRRLRTLALLALTFAVGFNLRAAVLGVPPVLSTVRGDLHLSYSQVGLLGGMPILAFGLTAIPAARLVRRLGGWQVVVAGLGLAAAGELLRVVPLQPAALFVGTAIMGVGIAATQLGLPVLVQAWFRGRVQSSSVTLTLGITVGELVAASATGSALLPAVGSWQGTMVFWGLLGLLCAGLWAAFAPRADAGRTDDRTSRWLPLVRPSRVWAVYACFAGQSLVFFSANTWIPLSAPGGSHSAAATLALAALNGVMVPVDLVLVFWPRQFATRWEFYLAGGLVVLLGCLAWIWWGPTIPWLGPGLIGAGVATNFAGLLAYPPLVAPAHQVAQLTSVMLAVGYGCAFMGPLLGGVAVDLGGGRLSPFIPITLAAAVMMVVSPAVPRSLPRRLVMGEALTAG